MRLQVAGFEQRGCSNICIAVAGPAYTKESIEKSVDSSFLDLAEMPSPSGYFCKMWASACSKVG